MTTDPNKDALREQNNWLAILRERLEWERGCDPEDHGRKLVLRNRQRKLLFDNRIELVALLDKVEAVLKPFAEAAIDVDERGGADDGTCPDAEVIGDASSEEVNVGHCRAARTLLTKLQQARGDRG